jgi:hypothetical protein
LGEGEKAINKSPQELTEMLRGEVFRIKDESGKLPEGDKNAAILFWAKTLETYTKYIMMCTYKVQEYFKENNVPIGLIKAIDIYHHDVMREMRNQPVVEEDPNLHQAVSQSIEQMSKGVDAMVEIARKAAENMGSDYDEDY